MFEAEQDQATGLREMFEQPASLAVLPMVATRRGMGFRSLVTNIAAACTKLGQRVVVIDAGPAGTAYTLGMRVPLDLANLLSGDRTFEDVAVRASEGIYVINAQKGIPAFVAMAGDAEELFLGFRRFEQPFDIAILAGHVPEVASMTRNQDDIVFVTNTDSESLTATYAEIKRAHSEYEQNAFRVLVNRVDDEREGLNAFKRLAETARKFLGVSIEFGGSIARDSAFGTADRAQRSVYNVAATSNAAKQISQLVQSMQAWRLGRYALTEN
jgi:flagellar biosynthesis protein FlhG